MISVPEVELRPHLDWSQGRPFNHPGVTCQDIMDLMNRDSYVPSGLIQVVKEGRLVPQMISRNFNITQQGRLFLGLGCHRSFLRTYEPEVNICMRLSDVDITCVI